MSLLGADGQRTFTVHLILKNRRRYPGRVGGRGIPAEETPCRKAQSEETSLIQGIDIVWLEFGAEGGEQGKKRWEKACQIRQALSPNLNASKSFKQGRGLPGMKICSDLGCSVEEGQTSGMDEDTVETIYWHSQNPGKGGHYSEVGKRGHSRAQDPYPSSLQSPVMWLLCFGNYILVQDEKSFLSHAVSLSLLSGYLPCLSQEGCDLRIAQAAAAHQQVVKHLSEIFVFFTPLVPNEGSTPSLSAKY